MRILKQVLSPPPLLFCPYGVFTNILQKFHLIYGIAIYGDPFVVAGKKAFHQLVSNSLRVFTINSLGDFVLFMGKAFVVVITVFSGIELLRPKENVIHHMWVPLTMASIFAYMIAHCFITVYEVSFD